MYMSEIPVNSATESVQDVAAIRAAIETAFHPEYYLAGFSRQDAAGADPLLHFISEGWREGRDPSPFFSTGYYLGVNRDVADAGINPLYHYLVCGLQEGRRPLPLPRIYRSRETEFQRVKAVVEPEFDREFYAGRYPEAVRQLRDLLEHFLIIGWSRGLDPVPWFSVSCYLQENGDVRESGVNPFYHYLVLGRMEGRRPAPLGRATFSERGIEQERNVLQAEFDADFYLLRNEDVRAAGRDPLEHYISDGWKEGRDPAPDFSTSYYLQTNPDVNAKGINPFYHYLVTGRREGRQPALPGGAVSQALYTLTSLDRQVRESWQRDVSGGEVHASAESLRGRIDGRRAEQPSRTIISLGHDDYRTEIGGVQRCIQLEQVAANAAGAMYINLFPVCPMPVLAPDEGADNLLLQVICDGESLGIAPAAVCLEALQPLPARQVDLVVHALLGHAAGIVRRLAASVVNGRRIFWVHDYQSICPGYNLLRNTVRYCGVPDVGSMACSICIYGDERAIQSQRMESLFAALDFTVLVPSEFAAGFWRRHSSLVCRELVVQPHTRFVKREGSAREAVSGPAADVLRVAYTGLPVLHKGWAAFMRLVNANRGNPAYEFHVLSDQPTRDIAGVHFSRVRMSGGQHETMQAVLESLNIDLAFIWSIWPETYCLVAHEAVAAGVPVVTCAQSGNVALMVSECDRGVVFRDEGEMLEAFASGTVASMISTLRARGHVHPMTLEHSRMSLQQLGLPG